MRNPASGTTAFWIAALAPMLTACKAEPPRAPAPIEPDRIVALEGSIHLASGGEVPYRAVIAPKPRARGEYLGSVDIPKQALSGAGLERIVYEAGRRIEFDLPFPGTPRWVGVIHQDGSITCTFSQSDIDLPCSMRDVSPSPTLARD